MFKTPEPPQFKTQLAPPPKRKRTPNEVAEQITTLKGPKMKKAPKAQGAKKGKKVVATAREGGDVVQEGDMGAPAYIGGEGEEGGKKKRRMTKNKREDEVVSTLHMNAITFGATKRQRQWVRQAMFDGLVKSVSSSINASTSDPREEEVDEDALMEYISTVEQSAYDGIFGRDMHVVFNMYRNEYYRQHCFGIIYALRGCGALLMSRYAPDLLACLPQELLVKGTPLGAEVDAWKARVEFLEQRERELREAARAVKGEGWLRCPKCGGQFDTSLLQMRGADEPATLFMTCANCNFTKRKG